jgi:hypothetical protein
MRKPNTENLRAGQTLWYPSVCIGAHGIHYQPRAIQVLSDRAEVTPAYIVADGQPRWFVRDRMQVGGGPLFVSYSRRRVAAWIKLHGGRP